MSLCGNTECFGLEPCDGCRDVRVQIMNHAVKASGMTKEQAERFFGAYGEAFDGAITQIRRMRDEMRAQHVAQKEERDKQAQQKKDASSAEKKEKEIPTSPGVPAARKQERTKPPLTTTTTTTAAATDTNGTASAAQSSKPEEKAPASDLKTIV